MNIRVRPYGNHARCQDAGCAVQGGEGLVKLSHVTTDGRLALNHVYRMTGIRDFQGCLNACNPTTDDHGSFVNGNAQGFQWFVMDDALNCTGDHSFGFLGGGLFICMHP